jgi:hypothetical protein
MKTAHLLIVMLGCGMAAKADFSYSQTRKSSQAMPAAGGEATTKHFLKGQKMKVDSGKTASIFDFDAQTVTVLDNQQKTYTVTPFGDLGKGLPQTGMNANVDVKETGQKKNINGFTASEVVMTIAMQSQQGTQAMTMSVEMDMWISNDVPGAKELRAFYAKNGDRFPWAALGTGGGNPGMQKAIADMQKKMASIGGVPVMQITRMKTAGNPQMSAQMEQARAKFEEMKKQGGQQAAIAEQMLARMGGASGGSMFEITMESSGFSVNPIADSVFAVPGDYRKVTK